MDGKGVELSYEMEATQLRPVNFATLYVLNEVIFSRLFFIHLFGPLKCHYNVRFKRKRASHNKCLEGNDITWASSSDLNAVIYLLTLVCAITKSTNIQTDQIISLDFFAIYLSSYSPPCFMMCNDIAAIRLATDLLAIL